MIQKYEMIFNNFMEEKGIEAWYELFDSELFDIVAYRCYKLKDFDLEAFNAWTNEMAWEL